MEMEYREPGRRGKFVIILGVILAVAAGGAAFYLINQAQEQAGQGEVQRVAVVVAARDIPARKPIEADDLAVRQVPVDGTNAKGTFQDTAPLVGKVLSVTLLEGQMLTANMLASTSVATGFSILEPNETVAPDSEAWRAVSLTVPDVRAVAGLLQPGQTVDVFVTATVNVPQSLLTQGTYYTDRSTKVTYQDLLILARSGELYVVKATLAQAEEISHLVSAGNADFSIALRPEQDVRTIDVSGLGSTTNRIITKYGLPVPETYPAGGPATTLPPIAPPTPLPSPSPSPTQ
jgi:Flp pilus assembly protein CpaB